MKSQPFAVPALDMMSTIAFVFMVLTALAFQAEMEAAQALPRVSVTKSPGSPAGTGGPTVAVSAQGDATGGVRFFVNSSEVPKAQLGETLRALAPERALLRIDEELPTKHVVELMTLLNALKISGISLAVRGE